MAAVRELAKKQEREDELDAEQHAKGVKVIKM
jgi:hypothetical protein